MQDQEDTMRLPRVTVEWKIPLWGVVSAGGGLVWSLVAMYFQLTQVSQQMAEMQALFKTSSAATVQLASDQALLKYRVEKLEAAAHTSATK